MAEEHDSYEGGFGVVPPVPKYKNEGYAVKRARISSCRRRPKAKPIQAPQPEPEEKPKPVAPIVKKQSKRTHHIVRKPRALSAPKPRPPSPEPTPPTSPAPEPEPEPITTQVASVTPRLSPPDPTCLLDDGDLTLTAIPPSPFLDTLARARAKADDSFKCAQTELEALQYQHVEYQRELGEMTSRIPLTMHAIEHTERMIVMQNRAKKAAKTRIAKARARLSCAYNATARLQAMKKQIQERGRQLQVMKSVTAAVVSATQGTYSYSMDANDSLMVI